MKQGQLPLKEGWRKRGLQSGAGRRGGWKVGVKSLGLEVRWVKGGVRVETEMLRVGRSVEGHDYVMFGPRGRVGRMLGWEPYCREGQWVGTSS